MKYCSLSLLALLTALAPLGAASEAKANQELPAFIESFEEVTPQINNAPVGRARSAAGDVEISFEARGRSYHLSLSPSTSLAGRTEITRITDAGSVTEAPSVAVYEGSLEGDPTAVVRVVLSDQGMDGLIIADDDMVFLEPASRYGRGADGGTIVYAASEVNEYPEALGCGVDGGHQLNLSDLRDAVATGRTPRGIGGSLGLLEVGMVGDFELFQQHGAGTATRILTLMALVDGIYVAELNTTLAVTEIVVFETAADPFSNDTNSNSFLDEIGEYREAPGSPVGETGLAHLITGRNLAGSTIGIAWVDTLCSDFFGSGLSEDFTSNTFTMSLLIAHELGHNFGADHDGQNGSSCNNAPFGHIMWPSIGGGMTNTFSQCSIDVIEPNVLSASCIVDAIPVGCGNGILGGGEECDDGNNVNGDCCRVDCKFENPGAVCSSDANACTDDVCDGAGSCTHPNNTDPCDDGDICTAPGSCSGGACQPSGILLPLDRVKLKAKFKGGVADDKMLIKANVLTDGSISPPSSAGMYLELIADGSPVWSATIPSGPAWDVLGSKGVSFRYNPSASPPASEGGIDKLQVKYKISKGIVQVKAKTADFDLPGLIDEDELTLRIQVGDGILGDCGETDTMSCTIKPTTQVSCRTL